MANMKMNQVTEVLLPNRARAVVGTAHPTHRVGALREQVCSRLLVDSRKAKRRKNLRHASSRVTAAIKPDLQAA